MKRIYQTILHDPDNGQYGDCTRACIASVLELDIEEVPHFTDKNRTYNLAMDKIQEFLMQYGLILYWSWHETKYLSGVISRVKWGLNSNPLPIPLLIQGKSKRGFSHTIVATSDGKFHDPHPDSKGKDVELEPYTRGLNRAMYFMVGILIPFDPRGSGLVYKSRLIRAIPNAEQNLPEAWAKLMEEHGIIKEPSNQK